MEVTTGSPIPTKRFHSVVRHESMRDRIGDYIKANPHWDTDESRRRVMEAFDRAILSICLDRRDTTGLRREFNRAMATKPAPASNSR